MLELIDIEFIQNFPLNQYIKIEFNGKFYIFRIEDFTDNDFTVRFKYFLWIETINTKELIEYKSKCDYSSRNHCNNSFLNHIQKLIKSGVS
jgi:hypothetical protein